MYTNSHIFYQLLGSARDPWVRHTFERTRVFYWEILGRPSLTGPGRRTTHRRRGFGQGTSLNRTKGLLKRTLVRQEPFSDLRHFGSRLKDAQTTDGSEANSTFRPYQELWKVYDVVPEFFLALLVFQKLGVCGIAPSGRVAFSFPFPLGNLFRSFLFSFYCFPWGEGNGEREPEPKPRLIGRRFCSGPCRREPTRWLRFWQEGIYVWR